MTSWAVMASGALAGVAGIGVLRLAWGRAERSACLNTVGWALVSAGLVAGWFYAGAWGVSIVSLSTMGAGLLLVAVAAYRDTAAPGKRVNRRAATMSEPRAPRYSGRRAMTFAIVMAGGFAAAIALALIMRWGAVLGNASEADANVLAFFSVPLTWSILAFLLLMTTSRKRQTLIVTLPIVTVLSALLAGGLS